MNRNFFENISIIGREAYAILCAESYLDTVYPEKDWKPITDIMWKVVESDKRDDWAYSFCDIIPEYLFEPESFDEANFKSMTASQYETFVNLLKDTDDNVNTIFTALYDIIMDYAYTSIPGKGDDALDDLQAVCDCLDRKGIPLPDESLVAFSSFEEQRGWGLPFNRSRIRR